MPNTPELNAAMMKQFQNFERGIQGNSLYPSLRGDENTSSALTLAESSAAIIMNESATSNASGSSGSSGASQRASISSQTSVPTQHD